MCVPSVFFQITILVIPGLSSQHIIASREHGQDPISFSSAAFNQMKLSQLDPDIFRMPKFRADVKSKLECQLKHFVGSLACSHLLSDLYD
jgi:hypothetical protein